MANLDDFPFREFEAGPRRDVARQFHELVRDLSWLKDGEEKDEVFGRLLNARNQALLVAHGMLR